MPRFVVFITEVYLLIKVLCETTPNYITGNFKFLKTYCDTFTEIIFRFCLLSNINVNVFKFSPYSADKCLQAREKNVLKFVLYLF